MHYDSGVDSVSNVNGDHESSSGSEARSAPKDDIHTMCEPIVYKMWDLGVSQPFRSPRLVTRIAFLLLYEDCLILVCIFRTYVHTFIFTIPGTATKKKLVGLERGPLSLVSTTKEILNRKVAAAV
jgi:hypothetical protein